ncbi:MAG TPA: glycosyltransferase family 2 protein [Solirubrobacteraceae bacterium]|nr:glycosyltransferase family 2 protein [Solirubrobacteraceae bacterium]
MSPPVPASSPRDAAEPVASRPAVDVVLPFRGSDDELLAAAERLAGLLLRPGDTATIADNRRGASVSRTLRGVRIVGAGELQTSYHARNRGAAGGSAPWLVFVDADVSVSFDLLDRYFDPSPDDRVGVLAGGVVDRQPVGDRGSLAERYAWRKASMSQDVTLADSAWPFAQTANAAVRRAAFAEVGGFQPAVRSGGDADLCFRLRAAGWTLERREAALVSHRARPTVARMLAQRARHGAGAGWLSRRWPGALPRRRWSGLAWWSVRRAGTGLAAAARGDRDEAVVGLLDGPAVWAFELGRLVPNRPLPRFGGRVALRCEPQLGLTPTSSGGGPALGPAPTRSGGTPRTT